VVDIRIFLQCLRRLRLVGSTRGGAENAGVENAGVEIAREDSKGGNCN